MTSESNLRHAAQAVIKRWDTPLWKDVPATATYINALRAAIEREEAQRQSALSVLPVAELYRGRVIWSCDPNTLGDCDLYLGAGE